MLGRLGRESARAVVHPHHEPAIGRGEDVKIPVAIDVGGDHMTGVDVILRRDLAGEGAGIRRAGSDGGCEDQSQREASTTNQRAGTQHAASIIRSRT